MHPCKQILTTKGGGGFAAAPFCCKYLSTRVHSDPLEVWYAPGQSKVPGGPLGFHQKRKYIPEYGKVSGVLVRI